MKPNETAIHQMYRTSIQLYIFPHMVTEPQYRDTVIQRDTARYSDTAIQRDTPIHMYHHPSGLHVTSPRQSSLANILGRPTKCSECSPSVQSVRHDARTVGAAAPTPPLCRCAGLLFPPPRCSGSCAVWEATRMSRCYPRPTTVSKCEQYVPVAARGSQHSPLNTPLSTLPCARKTCLLPRALRARRSPSWCVSQAPQTRQTRSVSQRVHRAEPTSCCPHEA